MKGRYSATRFTGLLLGAALAVCAPAWGQVELNVVGTWGGAVNAVFIDEAVNLDIAYVGSGRRLVILNVADPTNILELGSIDLGATVLDVAVRDQYAFVARGRNPDLHVIDISNPADPQVVWTNNNNTARQVRLHGNAAYVRARNFDVYDVSDPENPRYIRSVLGPQVNDFVIQGELLYMVDEFQHVRIYDLSADPFNPVEIGIVTLPGTEESGKAIDVEGSYAYAATRNPGGLLAIVDVSTPATPFVAGTFDTQFAEDVAISNGVVYLVDAGDLVILDVSNPSSPNVLATFQTDAQVLGAEVMGNRVFVRDSGEGVIILDVTQPASPARLGNWHSPLQLRKMQKVGDLLYVTDSASGFSVLDVADPAVPALVGVYQADPSANDLLGIEIRNDLAYLSAGSAGIEIADVSNPANPTFLGAFRLPARFWSGALKLSAADPNIAHVGVTDGNNHSMRNFDITDPSNIVEVGSVSIGSLPITIATDPAAWPLSPGTVRGAGS